MRAFIQFIFCKESEKKCFFSQTWGWKIPHSSEIKLEVTCLHSIWDKRCALKGLISV